MQRNIIIPLASCFWPPHFTSFKVHIQLHLLKNNLFLFLQFIDMRRLILNLHYLIFFFFPGHTGAVKTQYWSRAHEVDIANNRCKSCNISINFKWVGSQLSPEGSTNCSSWLLTLWVCCLALSRLRIVGGNSCLLQLGVQSIRARNNELEDVTSRVIIFCRFSTSNQFHINL